MSTTAAMYLDFETNRKPLKERFAGILRSVGRQDSANAALPNDPLGLYIAAEFSEGGMKSLALSRLSLDPNRPRVLIRPVAPVGLEPQLPPGTVLGIVAVPNWLPGSKSRGPSLRVEQIVWDRAQEAVEGERAFRAACYTKTRPGVLADHANVISNEVLLSLPSRREGAAPELLRWKEYLAWRQEVVKAGLTGVRYVERRVDSNGLLCFTAAAESEDAMSKSEALFRKDEVWALELAYSSNEWKYVFAERHRGKKVELGSFEGSKRLDPLPSELESVKFPWPNPCVRQLRFRPPEDLNCGPGDNESKPGSDIADQLDSVIPRTGFLALCGAGDFALIRRQDRELTRFTTGEFLSPRVAECLFDMSRARGSAGRTTIENTAWSNPLLNEEQQSAVIMALDCGDLALIQGPPGTGKTAVIAEISTQAARRGQKVLVASQANDAVDNALERITSAHGVRCVRLGAKDGDGKRRGTGVVPFIGAFYSGIVRAVETSYLAPWRQIDEEADRLRKGLTKTKLLLNDAQSSQQRLDSQRRRVQECTAVLESLRMKEKQAATCRQEKLEAKRLLDVLDGRNEGAVRIPPGLRTKACEEMFARALAIAGLGEWPAWAAAKGRAASDVPVDVLVRSVHRFRSDLATIQTDLARLQRGTTKSVLSMEDEDALVRVKCELDAAEKQLAIDDGFLPVWRNLKAEERSLRDHQRGLDRSVYERVFRDTPADGIPVVERVAGRGALREDAVGHISAALERATPLLLAVEEGLARFRQDVEGYLARMDWPEPSPAETRTADRVVRAESASLSESEKRHQRLLEALVRAVSAIASEPPSEPIDVDAARRALEAAEKRLLDLEGLQSGQAQDRRVLEPLLTEWARVLTDPEIQKLDADLLAVLFAQCAHVVGATCNEDRRTLEDKGFKEFGLVVVDEVSKATPLELLMPLSLADRAVLVGDHRQLPPTFREKDGSVEELFQRNEEEGGNDTLLTRENFERFKALVTASRFKDLFENSPNGNRSSLLTQYRMHPDIMAVVNRFYQDLLKSGLDDPDGQRSGSDPRSHRKHGLTLAGPHQLPYLRPDNHVVWIDSSRYPDGKPAYEEQAGTSKVNRLEVDLIVEILEHMEEHYARQGLGTSTKEKQVAVISFYGKQVKALRDAIRHRTSSSGAFRSIAVDVNTVDRFQGRERPIVIVSLVRNPKRGTTSSKAFVAQFERINVAFSRAQELLVIVGAEQQFRDYNVTLPHMSGGGSSERLVYREILTRLDSTGRVVPSGAVTSRTQRTLSRCHMSNRR